MKIIINVCSLIIISFMIVSCASKEEIRLKQLEFQKVEHISKQKIIFTDEFLDPIMKTEIKEPILLPKCNNIMDKSILEEMLLYNNINPFTQDELYMEDVLKYNEKDDSKILIQNFLKRKDEFITKYEK